MPTRLGAVFLLAAALSCVGTTNAPPDAGALGGGTGGGGPDAGGGGGGLDAGDGDAGAADAGDADAGDGLDAGASDAGGGNDGGSSALARAAAGLAPNAFVAFEQPSLSLRTPHPDAGLSCDPTEDCAQYTGHTMIDWAGKAAWDPVSRRAMWAACGAGNNFAGGYRYNTHSVYAEDSDSWSVTRGFQAPNESNSNPIVHMYDSNCIDVVGRRFYKKKFPTAEILVFDLVSDTWLPTIASTPDEADYARDGALEVVPTRGAAGALWLTSWRRSDNLPTLWEYDLATTQWSVLVPGGAFGGAASVNSPVLSYNPRAFAGDGGVLLGNQQGAWVIQTNSLARAQVAPPPAPLVHPYDGHLCRDPSGDGWLLAANDGYLYRTDGVTWTQRARLPDQLGAANHRLPVVCIPIDTYGVVWLVSSAGATHRAWLYRP